MYEIAVYCKGIMLRNCLEQMLVFCALDAYRLYDRWGAKLNTEHGDVIHRDHVKCINIMNARSRVEAWAPFMPGTDILSDLPSDKHLLEMDDGDWPAARGAVLDALRMLTSQKYIGLAAATKLLALKRPNLIPPCDSQLLEWFDIRTYYYADQAAQIMDRFREIGRTGDNLITLRALQSELGVRGIEGETIRLSTTRILEVLCWMATTDRYTDLLRLLGWQ